MHQLKLLFFFSFLFFRSINIASEYKFEGYFNNHDNARLLVVSLFLPYNPTIVAYSTNPQLREQCAKQWPKGFFYQCYTENQIHPCHFLWVDNKENQLSILAQYCHNPELKVIYTSTTFAKNESHYETLKNYLKSQGFVLLSHWYWENEHGNAIFLREDIFNSAMRSWNYSPTGNTPSVAIQHSVELQKFFKKAKNKQKNSHFEEIDFIYMINLDERPEKFALTKNSLNEHNIHPYRFSAVNGWKLPLSTIQQVGVPFSNQMAQDHLMGTIYKKIDGDECISNELITKEQEVYFALGLTRGAIGIVLSHLSVLQDAYDSGYKTIWVMEDDVEVLENPKCLPHLIRHLDRIDPKWDILFTDPDTKDTEGNYVPCRSLAARPNVNILPLSSFFQHFYPVSQELSRTGMRYGAYSMILRRSGIKKILDYFKTYRIFLPYDMDYWLIPGIRMYCPHQAIISHRPKSITDNGRPNYLHSHQ